MPTLSLLALVGPVVFLARDKGGAVLRWIVRSVRREIVRERQAEKAVTRFRPDPWSEHFDAPPPRD